MKKNVIIILLIMSAMTSVISQEMSFGIKAHVSDYSYRGDDWDSFESFYGVENELSLSFGVSAFVEMQLSKSFAIQPELGFTLAKHQYGDGSLWITENYKVVEIPVYAKFLFPSSAGNFYVMAGPEIMMALGNVEIENSLGGTSTDTLDNNILFGVSIAVGTEYKVGNGAAIIGLRYSTFFSEAFDDVEMYSRGLGIEAGYKF